MIVLTSGVKVAPVPLEHAVLKVLSIIANQAVVIGDGRQYLVCLITLKVVAANYHYNAIHLSPRFRLFWIWIQ